VAFIARALGRDVAKAVVREAIAEARGETNRKWALMLLAFLAGTIVAVIVIKRRGGHLAIEDDPRWAEMTNPILRSVPTADVS
jgi:hypothetical protein